MVVHWDPFDCLGGSFSAVVAIGGWVRTFQLIAACHCRGSMNRNASSNHALSLPLDGQHLVLIELSSALAS